MIAPWRQSHERAELIRVPTLADLPPPPPGKIGWPWTVESYQVPERLPDGASWPKVSIVTPSYNQGKFIEETIRSVLLQGYPNLEYMVYDAGSTDGALDIIKKYQSFLTHWSSEPDRGQAHAINKALFRSTGYVFQFINSDDLLAPGALRDVASQLRKFDAVAGGATTFGEGQLEKYEKNSSLSPVCMILGTQEYRLRQPGLWLVRNKMIDCGGFNESLQYVFDWEFAIRYFSRYSNINYIDCNLAYFRHHGASKTIAHGSNFYLETLIVLEGLVRSPQHSQLRAAAQRALRTYRWSDEIEKVRAETHRSSLVRAASLTIKLLGDPAVRINRFSLGAIARILGLRNG